MKCTRRSFLGAAAAGLVLAPGITRLAAQGASDRIRIGVIGTGGRARGLMTLLNKLPGNEMVAVCDVYEPRVLQAAEIAGATAAKVPTIAGSSMTAQIDAIVVGTPDHWHKTDRRSMRSLPARTSTSRSRFPTRMAEGVEMVRVYRSLEADRPDRHAATKLGSLPARQADHRFRTPRPDHVRPHLLVSTRYRGQLSAGRAEQLDWKRWLGPAPDQPFRPERFYQWRHFWDFGGGCITDLMTHWIDVVQWYMNAEAPMAAETTGHNYNIKLWEAPDTVNVSLEFPKTSWPRIWGRTSVVWTMVGWNSAAIGAR